MIDSTKPTLIRFSNASKDYSVKVSIMTPVNLIQLINIFWIWSETLTLSSRREYWERWRRTYWKITINFCYQSIILDWDQAKLLKYHWERWLNMVLLKVRKIWLWISVSILYWVLTWTLRPLRFWYENTQKRTTINFWNRSWPVSQTTTSALTLFVHLWIISKTNNKLFSNKSHQPNW